MSSEAFIVRQSDDLSDMSRGRYRTTPGASSDKLADMPRKDRQFDKAVGDRLEVVRKSRNLTKRAFAKELGVDEDRYSSWANGKNGLPPQFALMIRDRYKVSLDWLYAPIVRAKA